MCPGRMCWKAFMVFRFSVLFFFAQKSLLVWRSRKKWDLALVFVSDTNTVRHIDGVIVENKSSRIRRRQQPGSDIYVVYAGYLWKQPINLTASLLLLDIYSGGGCWCWWWVTGRRTLFHDNVCNSRPLSDRQNTIGRLLSCLVNTALRLFCIWVVWSLLATSVVMLWEA